MFYIRHPLQELVVDTFVPNDAFLLGGSGMGVGAEAYVEDNNSEEPEEDRYCVKNSIIVCTGANACGKVTFISKFPLFSFDIRCNRAYT